MMRNVCDYNLTKWDHYFSKKYVIIILFLSNSASRRTNHQKILVAYKNHMLHGNLCEDRVFSCMLRNTFFVGTWTIFCWILSQVHFISDNNCVMKIKDILCLNFCNVDGLDSSNTYTADLENEKLQLIFGMLLTLK